MPAHRREIKRYANTRLMRSSKNGSFIVAAGVALPGKSYR
jgi:hypothetical protein